MSAYTHSNMDMEQLNRLAICRHGATSTLLLLLLDLTDWLEPNWMTAISENIQTAASLLCAAKNVTISFSQRRVSFKKKSEIHLLMWEWLCHYKKMLKINKKRQKRKTFKTSSNRSVWNWQGKKTVPRWKQAIMWIFSNLV